MNNCYLFELNFDQGGYAGLLLLSGITVNSALFILNDYNNLKKTSKPFSNLEIFLKAFQAKIIPITLTILSTLLGLSPFLLGGADKPFWFGRWYDGRISFFCIGDIGLPANLFIEEEINQPCILLCNRDNHCVTQE